MKNMRLCLYMLLVQTSERSNVPIFEQRFSTNWYKYTLPIFNEKILFLNYIFVFSWLFCWLPNERLSCHKSDQPYQNLLEQELDQPNQNLLNWIPWLSVSTPLLRRPQVIHKHPAGASQIIWRLLFRDFLGLIIGNLIFWELKFFITKFFWYL